MRGTAGRGAPLAVLACGAVLCGGAAHASPWGRAPGDVFISTKSEFFSASAPSTDPEAPFDIRFERIDASAYVEVGLGAGLTIGGKSVYGTSTFNDGFSVFTADGVSEAEGFLQVELHRDARQVVAARLSGAAPTRFETGARPGLATDGVDLEARGLYGRTIATRPVKLFAGVEAGYRRRLGSAADQLRVDATFGVEPSRRILALLDVFSIKSLGAAEPGGADFDVVKIQPSLALRLARGWTVQAGYVNEIAGRGLLRGDTYFLGFWTEF